MTQSELATRERDGEEFFNNVYVKIKRHYDNGNINDAQYKAIRTSLTPALQPLKWGDWDLAQDNINAIQRPSGNLSVLYDFLKNKIDDYILNNY